MEKILSYKKDKIEEFERTLGNNNFLIFQPPIEGIFYSNNEIIHLLGRLKGIIIPKELSTVQKSHWVKYKVIEIFGYKKPEGLRTEQAKKNKPKFINQLCDIFIQTSSNLQIWNYIPYDENIIEGTWNSNKIKYSQCRYIIIMHDRAGKIYDISLKMGSELAEWDLTGTKTIKWQANVPKALRETRNIIYDTKETIFNYINKSNNNIDTKVKIIGQSDINKDGPLIKKKPNSDTLFTIKEISEIIEPLKSISIPNPGSGQERVIGQILEKEITKAMGYTYFTRTDSGEFPDLLNQLIEIKFQYSGTIDLGRNLPTNPKPLDFEWNDWNVSNEQIRYCFFLMDLIDDTFVVQNIVIVSGKNFPDYFNICAGKSFKVQLTIPKKNS